MFKVDNLTDTHSHKLKDRMQQPINIAGADADIGAEMAKVYTTTASGDTLIGRDLNLQFKDKQLQQLFSQQVGRSPICYIYYFAGTLKTPQTFRVEAFQLAIKMPNCIATDDME